MMNARNRKGWSVFLWLSVISFCAGCSNGGNASQAPPIAAAPVARAIRTSLNNSVTLTGEFQPFFEVDVMAKEAGYIRHMYVDIGDHVKKGQLLATLEIPELEDDLTRAKAGVQEATADIAVAKGDFRRAQASNAISHLSYTRILEVSRREVGLVPLQEVDVAHSRDLESEAQVFAAEQHVEASENQLAVAGAELARQQALWGYTRITAPFDGIVTARFASDGSMIQAGTASETQVMPVVTVAQNNILRLMLPVPEEYVGVVHDGDIVTVSVPSLHRSFVGKVTRFSGNVLLSTRTMTTEVDVPNPHLKLLPGLYAEVALQTADASHAIAVPVEAIDGVGSNQSVFVVDKSNTIRVRKVTVGLQSPQYVQILSGGIEPGDVVIIGRHSDYHDGQKVIPRFEEPPSASASHS